MFVLLILYSFVFYPRCSNLPETYECIIRLWIYYSHVNFLFILILILICCILKRHGCVLLKNKNRHMYMYISIFYKVFRYTNRFWIFIVFLKSNFRPGSFYRIPIRVYPYFPYHGPSIFSLPGSVYIFPTRICLHFPYQGLSIFSLPGSVYIFPTRICLYFPYQDLSIFSLPGSVYIFPTRICIYFPN